MGRTYTDREISEIYGSVGKNVSYFVRVGLIHHLERIAKENKCSFRNAITLCIDKYLYFENKLKDFDKMKEQDKYDMFEEMMEEIRMGKLLDDVSKLPYEKLKFLYHAGKVAEHELGKDDKNNIIEKFVETTTTKTITK